MHILAYLRFAFYSPNKRLFYLLPFETSSASSIYPMVVSSVNEGIVSITISDI